MKYRIICADGLTLKDALTSFHKTVDETLTSNTWVPHGEPGITRFSGRSPHSTASVENVRITQAFVDYGGGPMPYTPKGAEPSPF